MIIFGGPAPETLEDTGVIGPADGSRAREVK